MDKTFSVIIVKNDVVSVFELVAANVFEAQTKTLKIKGITESQKHLYKLFILEDCSSN